MFLKQQQPSNIAIYISSAGQEPWETIERYGQSETFFKIRNGSPIYWYQGENKHPPIYEILASRIFEKSYQIFWSGTLVENWFHVTKLNRQRRNGIIPFLFNNLVEVRFSQDLNKVENNRLKLPVSNRYGVTGLKALLAIKHFVECTDADFMLRTNSSSYFDIPKLQEYIQTLPRNGVYAGLSIQLGKVNFKSGSANIISRDVATKILGMRKAWNHEYPEDVALGNLIQQYGLAVDYSFGIVEIQEASEVNGDNFEANDNIFHFRCKAETPEKSVLIMKTIHKQLFQ